MANKPISKTAAIREELKKSDNGSPTEIAKALNKQGVQVTAAYVSTIKASDKRKVGAPKRKPGPPVRNASASTPVEDLKEASELLLKAVDLVLKAGGKEARQLVGMATQLIDRVGDRK
jgi:arginine repressor